MRNLLQYPVTDEERIEVLTSLRETILSEQRMGDMRPLVLGDAIRKFVEPTEANRQEQARRVETFKRLYDYLDRRRSDDTYPYDMWRQEVALILVQGLVPTGFDELPEPIGEFQHFPEIEIVHEIDTTTPVEWGSPRDHVCRLDLHVSDYDELQRLVEDGMKYRQQRVADIEAVDPVHQPLFTTEDLALVASTRRDVVQRGRRVADLIRRKPKS